MHEQMMGGPMMHGQMMHGQMMGGMGVASMWLFMLLGTIGLAAVVSLPWLLLKRVDRQASGIAVLKRRLAAGEISDEEYSAKLTLLKQ